MSDDIDVTRIDSAVKGCRPRSEGGAAFSLTTIRGINIDIPLVIAVDDKGKTQVYRHGEKVNARSISFSAEVDGVPIVKIEEYLK